MKPIIFNTEMVRAILDGRKTQTRRVIKPQPPDDYQAKNERFECQVHHKNWLRCPYGQPGDELWVRETWRQCGYNKTNYTSQIAYKADGEYSEKYYHYKRDKNENIKMKTTKWRPSIHMPKWASRITLQITNVRVERVQDISEEDAKAEGVSLSYNGKQNFWKNYKISFSHLWNIINAANGYGWDDMNPWVWVIEFRRV